MKKFKLDDSKEQAKSEYQNNNQGLNKKFKLVFKAPSLVDKVHKLLKLEKTHDCRFALNNSIADPNKNLLENKDNDDIIKSNIRVIKFIKGLSNKNLTQHRRPKLMILKTCGYRNKYILNNRTLPIVDQKITHNN